MKEKNRKHFDDVLRRHPELEGCGPDITKAFDCIVGSYRAGGKLLVCGNGGSAADAEHIVGELMNKFLLRHAAPADLSTSLKRLGYDNAGYLYEKIQKGLPAISLVSQNSLCTAILNDVAADMVFAQQVYGYGRTGDVLLALSTSGNSPNILNAIKVGKAIGVMSVGLTGSSGGAMKELCDICICAPETMTYKIQELHVIMYHLICAMVEEEFFGVT